MKRFKNESRDKSRKQLALLELIVQSEADLEMGRVVSQEEAFARAEHAISEATSPSAAESFRQGWQEAMSGQTFPVSELWKGTQ